MGSAATTADGIIRVMEGVKFENFSSKDRLRLMDAAYRCRRTLQTERELGWEAAVTMPILSSAIATLVRANVFPRWAEAGWKPKTSTELAELIGPDADPAVLREFFFFFFFLLFSFSSSFLNTASTYPTQISIVVLHSRHLTASS